MKCLLIFIINPIKKDLYPTFQVQKLRFRELKALAQGIPEPRIQAELSPSARFFPNLSLLSNSNPLPFPVLSNN